jgi:hypothetical protein
MEMLLSMPPDSENAQKIVKNVIKIEAFPDRSPYMKFVIL